MLIRRARVEDAPAIAAIVETLRYRPGQADPAKGYLVFVGTAEEYTRRLEENYTGYVAEIDGQVVGFLLTTPMQSNTLLIDQIGVLPHIRAAAELYAYMLAELQPERMRACIMHAPVFNKRSVGFFRGKCGFECIGTNDEGDGFVWGVYEKAR